MSLELFQPEPENETQKFLFSLSVSDTMVITGDHWPQVFLDAIGEAAGSSRRLGDRGIYEHRVLNRGHRGKEVDLVLLDERYERVPLPCHTRADFCQPTVEKSASRVVRSDSSILTSNNYC